MPTGENSLTNYPLKLFKKTKQLREGAGFATNELDPPSRQNPASFIILFLAKEKSKLFNEI